MERNLCISPVRLPHLMQWWGWRVSVFSKEQKTSATQTLETIKRLSICDPACRFLHPYPLWCWCPRRLCPSKPSNQNWGNEREAIRNFVEQLSLSCVFWIIQHLIIGIALCSSLESQLFSSVAWPEAYLIKHCRMYFIKTTYLRLSTILHRLITKSKTVLNSGIHAVNSVFQLLHFSLCKWNLNVILDSLSFISDSKAQDFRFLK